MSDKINPKLIKDIFGDIADVIDKCGLEETMAGLGHAGKFMEEMENLKGSGKGDEAIAALLLMGRVMATVEENVDELMKYGGVDPKCN